ncbi:MAG: twin-arginine translocase TatA/TatE family subunit [Nitrospirae bacterium]|jgi:sec-independent protein translocase protein TatA|nr:twin-arginine translocase TatA/TatE family subunit [Nitrospirota bacterium]
MFGLGVPELVLILVIVVVMFGARRLPELGKGIGEAMRNFKKSVNSPDEIDVTPPKSAGETKPGSSEGKTA